MFRDELYVVCHNIRSLHNVGAIFRTADAAGVAKVFLTGYTGAPPRDEIKKVALGAEDRVLWEKKHDAWRVIEALQKKGVTVAALEEGVKRSIDYKVFKPRFPLALLVGNEVQGISKQLLLRVDYIIHLPMHGGNKSLNVSVACGIALYQLNSYRH